MARLKKYLPILLSVGVVLLTVYVCFYKLGSGALENWDEAWYADMTRNLMRSGNWITLFWNKELLLDKPPLFIWLASISSMLFGLSEWSIRFVSALSGSLLIFFVSYWSYKKWGLLSSLLTFLTLLLNNLFIWRTRSGNIDLLVTFLIFLTFIAIQMKNKNRYILLGFLFSFTYLAKASIVTFPLLIFTLHELFFMRKRIFSQIWQYAGMLFIICVLCGGWLFLGSLKEGWKFAHYYLFQSDQNTARVSLSQFNTDYFLYLYYSLQRRFSYLFLLGTILLLVKIKRSEYFLLFAFSTFLLILLSFSERTNNWYLLPSMPFWSLTIGYATYKTYNFIAKKYQLIFLSLFIPVVLYISYKTFTVNIQSIITTDSTHFQKLSSLQAARYSPSTTAILRIDQLYPTTVFYADRKVFSYRANEGNSALFLNKEGVETAFINKSIRWVVGKKDDMNRFLPLFSSFSWQKQYENREEVLYRVTAK